MPLPSSLYNTHKRMFQSLITLAVLAATLLECCASDVHYITPSHTVGCASSEPCFTLDEYTSVDAVERFNDNTEVQFMPGVHYLSGGTQHVLIRDRFNITLTGVSSSSNETVDIVCSNDTGFLFMNISELTISNLAFTFCGVQVEPQLLYEILFNQTRTFFIFSPLEMIAVGFVNVFSLQMSNVVIQNSTGFGVLGLNILGNSTITESHFLYNNFYTVSQALCMNLNSSDAFYQCTGGNVVLAYSDLLECPDVNQQYELEIISSSFVFGADIVGNTGSGLIIALSQSSYGVHINVDNATMMGNTASSGANIAIIMYDHVDNSSINIHNTYSGFGNPNFEPSLLRVLTRGYHRGAGLYFKYGDRPPSNFKTTCAQREELHQKEILRISDSWFVSNNGILGTGMMLTYYNVDSIGTVQMVVIENSVFADNLGSPGSALFIGQISPINNAILIKFLIKNCTFLNNNYPTTDLLNSVQQLEFDVLNAVQIISIEDITFADCSFIDNTGSAVYTYDSTLRFIGEITFENNSGIYGGAMSLHANSHILLTRNTTVMFTNNTARFRGGALFISSVTYRIRALCFWQIDDNQELGPVVISTPGSQSHDLPNISELLNINVLFDGNDASEAGTALYGGNIDTCNLLSTINVVSQTETTTIFDQIFQFDNSTEKNASLISSEPFSVCLCVDEVPNCSIHVHNISVFPGNTFDVSVTAHGQRGGLSPAVIFADFLLPYDIQHPPRLGHLQDTQEIGNNCTTLRYSVSSTDSSLRMLLAIENSILRLEPTYVNISLLPCPPGFDLSGDPPMCSCDTVLTAAGVKCDLSTQTVIREAPMWIGKEYLDENSDKKHIFVHEFCPYDYCLPGIISLDLVQQDMQCSFNRTGILCGACQQNLSRQLGSSACAECSNYYLFLLIPFALAGIVLVLLLFLLDVLTVSVGTINGLIFYANIVQFNRGVFFPSGESNVLTVFIAWLNLDLGIKTCFFNGLDPHILTWLQFAFPLYMFAIVGVITILSHRSLFISKVFGKHVVPVLATLIVFSFTKLLRTFIKMVAFTSIEHSDDTVSVAWFINPNIGYLQGAHILLFIIAVIGGVFVILPFTFVLLCSPCLLARSSHQPFKWVNKMKPFFDAYQGPYKDKFRNWTGFLLIVRIVLFVTFSFNVAGPNIILLVTIVAMQTLSLFSWIGGGVYKQWPLNLLEFSFFLNLGVLSAASLFLLTHSGSAVRQTIVVDISVSIALVEFVGILIYAIYACISFHCASKNEGEQVPRKSSLLDLGMQFLARRRSSAAQTELTVNSSSSSTREMVTAVELVHNGSDDFSIRLRESLIETHHLSQ